MKFEYSPSWRNDLTIENPDTNYVKIHPKLDGFWYNLDSDGSEKLINNDVPRYFQAIKTTIQIIPTTYTNVINWDSVIISDSIYSFNLTTGILTINSTGLFELSFHFICDVTGNNRIELKGKYQSNGVDIPGAFDHQYAARNNAQDNGSIQINNFLFNVTTSGAILNVQVDREGSNANLILGRMTIKKLKDL